MKKIILLTLIITAINNVFAQNLIPYYKKGYFGLCDIEGEILVEPIYSYVSFFNEKNDGYSIKKNGLYGLLNKDLKIIFEPISKSPIFKTNNQYVVQHSDKIEYYSEKDLKLISTRLISEKNNSIGFPKVEIRNEEEFFDHNNESVLLAFLKKNKLKTNKNNRYRIVGANGTYFEIYDNDKSIGIFLPKSNKFFIDDKENSYENPKWIPSQKKYYLIQTNSTGTQVIDENKNTILPEKTNTSYYIQTNHIEITEKLKDTEIKSLYILNSKKFIENKYDGFRFVKTIYLTNQAFDIFLTEESNIYTNYIDKLFIGENGKEYFYTNNRWMPIA